MTPARKPWIWCNVPGCDTKLIFARRAGTPENGPRFPYEYADRAPFSIEATGCHVLIDGTAWTPREAIEHFQTRGEGRTEEAARELVSGYPFHRPHFHERAASSAGKELS